MEDQSDLIIIIIVIIIIIIIIMAFKGAIQQCANHMQHIERYYVQVSCYVPLGTKEQLSY